MRRLARGGMGELYLARQEGAAGWAKWVAIKTILPHLQADEGARKRFMDEAHIAATLTHPNIVSVLDLAEEDDTLFLVMDYIEGWDLSALLRHLRNTKEQIPLAAAAYVVREAAAALAYAHEKAAPDATPLHIVHRDVSPGNLLLSREGRVLLTDFGIALARSRLDATRAGELRGKVAYMAPEQARGEVVDARADQYSLAVVATELLSLQRLVNTEDDELAVLNRVQRGDRLSVGQVAGHLPPEVLHVLERALSLDREARYPSMEVFVRAWEEAWAEAGVALDSSARVAAWLLATIGTPPRPETLAQKATSVDAFLQEGLDALLDDPASHRAEMTPSAPWRLPEQQEHRESSRVPSSDAVGRPPRGSGLAPSVSPTDAAGPGSARRGPAGALVGLVALALVALGLLTYWATRDLEAPLRDPRGSGEVVQVPTSPGRAEFPAAPHHDSSSGEDSAAPGAVEADPPPAPAAGVAPGASPGGTVADEPDGAGDAPTTRDEALAPGVAEQGSRGALEGATRVGNGDEPEVVGAASVPGPPRAAEPRPSERVLRLHGLPSQAEVWLDDRPFGTRRALAWPAGAERARLRVAAEGFDEHERELQPARDGWNIEVALRRAVPAEATVVLRFVEAPMVGRVRVDGVDRGMTTRLTEEVVVRAGRRLIEVEHPTSGHAARMHVDLVAGERRVLRVDWQMP